MARSLSSSVFSRADAAATCPSTAIEVLESNPFRGCRFLAESLRTSCDRGCWTASRRTSRNICGLSGGLKWDNNCLPDKLTLARHVFWSAVWLGRCLCTLRLPCCIQLHSQRLALVCVQRKLRSWKRCLKIPKIFYINSQTMLNIQLTQLRLQRQLTTWVLCQIEALEGLESETRWVGYGAVWRWWLCRPKAGGENANAEVDAIQWHVLVAHVRFEFLHNRVRYLHVLKHSLQLRCELTSAFSLKRAIALDETWI